MAWGCLTTNLGLPGFGSLLGGRAVGYAQIPFTVVGFGLSLIGTVHAFLRLVSEWTMLQQLETEDPVRYMTEYWHILRWPVLGVGIFVFVLLWALMTSLSIIASSRAAERAARATRPLPPKL